jgi:hypothetical protein
MRFVKKLFFFVAVLAWLSTSYAALPITGRCGFTFLIPNPDFNWHNPNLPIGTTKPTDVLGEIDFATQRITFNLTTATLVAVNATAGNTWTFSQSVMSASFANPPPAPVTGMTNAFAIAFTPAGSFTTTLNLLPTNSGNTFLIQGVNRKFAGVCQME